MVVVTIDYGVTHGATDPHCVVWVEGTNLTPGREAHAVFNLCPDWETIGGDDWHHYSASSVENNIGHVNPSKTASCGPMEGHHHKLCADTEASEEPYEGTTVSLVRSVGEALCHT